MKENNEKKIKNSDEISKLPETTALKTTNHQSGRPIKV